MTYKIDTMKYYTDTEFPGYKIDLSGVDGSLGTLLGHKQPLLDECLKAVGYWACHLVKETIAATQDVTKARQKEKIIEIMRGDEEIGLYANVSDGKPVLHNNGSHWELIDPNNGRILWSEDTSDNKIASPVATLGSSFSNSIEQEKEISHLEGQHNILCKLRAKLDEEEVLCEGKWITVYEARRNLFDKINELRIAKQPPVSSSGNTDRKINLPDTLHEAISLIIGAADGGFWDDRDSKDACYRILQYAKKANELLPQSHTSKTDEQFEIELEGNFYPAECEQCGWVGSSGDCDGGRQIADTGDYSDPICPICGSLKIEETDIRQEHKSFYEKHKKALEVIKTYRSLYNKAQDKFDAEQYDNPPQPPKTDEKELWEEVYTLVDKVNFYRSMLADQPDSEGYKEDEQRAITELQSKYSIRRSKEAD